MTALDAWAETSPGCYQRRRWDGAAAGMVRATRKPSPVRAVWHWAAFAPASMGGNASCGEDLLDTREAAQAACDAALAEKGYRP